MFAECECNNKNQGENMPDKYDDLFDFYIKLYDDEIARFRELDGKIARYLSAYSILIALTGFVGLNLRFLLQGGEITPLVIVNYIGLALVLLLLVPGWYYLLSALKLENLQRFAYDESVIQFFSDNEPVNIKYALSQRAKEAGVRQFCEMTVIIHLPDVPRSHRNGY